MTFIDDKLGQIKFLGKEKKPEVVPIRYSGADYLKELEKNEKYETPEEVNKPEIVSNWYIG
jgi:hypothetical protein